MSVLTNKAWWEAAGIRAIKTICQTAIASIGTSVAIEQVDWKAVVSCSALAGLLSLLMSLKGLPELKETQWEVQDETIESNPDESGDQK